MDGGSSNSNDNDSSSEMDGVDVVNENVVQNEVTIPEIGMKFESVEDMFQCFKKYAKYKGFAARKQRSKKNEDGILRSVTFVCCRGGKPKSTKSVGLLAYPTNETGCKVKLTSSFGRDGLWRINKLILEHNHDLSPSKAWLFRCYREIDEHVKKQLEFGDIAGIGPKKSYNQLVIEAGGHENCTFIEKDCRNHIEKARRLRLGEGDSVAIQNYFLMMQAQNSDFFFSMDLDEDGTLRNVFWADPRSREACKEFGDVVTFDTTYLTNKYDMPFAPFVGVNHHGESILLGCGLICSETTVNFVWLFRTWLTCMSDIAPHGIITDQDRAMQNAIEIVFPTTKHRWCLWHVMKKLPEKFGSHNEYKSIKSNLQRVVYDTQNSAEFEQEWSCFIEKFELQDNTWLNGLYRERHRWVPCFVTTHFWAGMSTTQRSEGINAFFDGYVNSKTTLKQFVEQYSYALKAKIHKENQADFKSFSQNIRLATTYGIEKQFQRVYTLKKFREVQVELLGMIYCDIIEIRESCMGMDMEFVITEDVEIDTDFRKEMRFTVVFEKDKCEVNCSCRRFQFRGILCKHALFVLIKNKVAVVPDRYIFDRWRKDIMRSHTRIRVNYDSGAVTPEMLRYKQMCSRFYKVADLATDDPDSCSLVMEWLEVKMNELYLKKYPAATPKPMEGNSNGNSPTDAPPKVQDPQRKKAKGRPRETRLKAPIEGSTQVKVHLLKTHVFLFIFEV